MIISSVRLGHANNSSSSHSILTGSKARRTLRGVDDDFDFGWSNFHLTTKEDKTRYLAALIYSSLVGMPSEFRVIIAQHMTGIDIPAGAGIGVDHQSCIDFPSNYSQYGRKELNIEFLKEFIECVKNNPKITILGGNDNSGGDDVDNDSPDRPADPAGGVPRFLGLPRDRGSDYCAIARKDGDWWTLYEKETGTKIRLSFNDDAAPYVKASRPELCDLCITKKCYKNCDFCYANATRDGKHAEFRDIEKILCVMGGEEVFECALGGGDPLSHPDFIKIIETAKMNGITPNFTTKDMWAFTKGKVSADLREAIIENCGSFAVSDLNEIRSIYKWNEMIEEAGKGPRCTLQIPCGCYDRPQIEKALRLAKDLYVPVTFLGYKRMGRGKDFKPFDYQWLPDYILDKDNGLRLFDYKGLVGFGADSVFVDEFRDKLIAAGIHEILMVNREGAFSCYIDAVDMKMGPSSFCDPAMMHDVDEKNVFGKFPY